MVVSEEAIEAAYAALLEGGLTRMLLLTNGDLRTALEAAAPHILTDNNGGK